MTKVYPPRLSPLAVTLSLLGLSCSVSAQEFQFDLDSISQELGRKITDEDLEALTEKARTGRQTYELIVNGKQDQTLQVVIEKKGDGYVATLPLKVLLAQNLKKDVQKRLEALPAESTFTDPATILPGSQLKVDVSLQTLELTIPQAWMSAVEYRIANPKLWNFGETALKTKYYLNYAKSWITDDRSQERAYGDFTTQFNLGAWRLINRSSFSYDASQGERQWEKEIQDTYLTRVIPDWNARVSLGTLATQSLFDTSIRIMGAEFRDEDDLHESFEKTYIPTISGVAESHSTVTIRQGGRTILVTEVAPGPFQFDNLEGLSYGGTVEVTVRGDNGRVQTFYVPYMTGVKQLKDGRKTWSIGAGKLDEEGTSRPYLITGSFGWGLPYGLTVFSNGTLAEKYQYGLGGIASDLGRLGAVALSLAHSNSDFEAFKQSGQTIELSWRKYIEATGSQMTMAYAKTLGGNPITLSQAARRPTDFYRNALDNTLESRLSMTWLQRLPFWDSTSVYATYIDERYQNGQHRRSLNSSIGMPIWGGTLTFGVQHSKYDSNQFSAGDTSDTTINVMLSLPLDRLLGQRQAPQLLATASHSNHEWQQAYNLYGNLTEDRRWLYSLGVNHSGSTDNTYSAGLSYEGDRFRSDLNVSHSDWSDTVSVNASGGVLIWKRGVLFSRDMDRSQAIVHVEIAKDLRVMGQMGGSNGDTVLVSGLADFQKNEVRLDPESVPSNVTVTAFVAEAIPADGAVLDLSIRSYAGTQVLFTLLQPDGQTAIPFGSSVQLESESVTDLPEAVIDDGGKVYIGSAPAKGNLIIRWIANGQQQQCRVPYQLASDEVALEGHIVRQTLTCHKE